MISVVACSDSEWHVYLFLKYDTLRPCLQGDRVSLALGIPSSGDSLALTHLLFYFTCLQVRETTYPGCPGFPSARVSFELLPRRTHAALYYCTALIKISYWRCLQIARYRKKIPCHWIVVRTGTKESIRRKADKTLFSSTIWLLTICWCYYPELFAW